MTREQMTSILMSYRRNKASAQYQKAMVQGLQKKLERARENMILDMQSLTPSLSGMPHASGISDKTADLAIKIADGYQTDQVKELREKLDQARAKEQHSQTLTMYVDAWLICLTDRQRFVIIEKTIKGSFVRDVIKGISQRFGEAYSKNGVKHIQQNALDRIYSMVGDE